MRLANHTMRSAKTRECLTSRAIEGAGEKIRWARRGIQKCMGVYSHSQQTSGKRTGHFVEMEKCCLYLDPIKDWAI